MILKCIDHYCMNSINLKLQVPNLVTYLQVENKGIQDNVVHQNNYSQFQTSQMIELDPILLLFISYLLVANTFSMSIFFKKIYE
jgi:hypothetical protein